MDTGDPTTPPRGWRLQSAYLSTADSIRLAELAEELDRMDRGELRGVRGVPCASMPAVAGHLIAMALRGDLHELAARIWRALERR
jgi:hypothetical protein